MIVTLREVKVISARFGLMLGHVQVLSTEWQDLIATRDGKCCRYDKILNAYVADAGFPLRQLPTFKLL